jgi:hypothetical protein
MENYSDSSNQKLCQMINDWFKNDATSFLIGPTILPMMIIPDWSNNTT